jgi:acetyl-CoA carboxylase biotin carboxyl carrier protein
MNQKIQTSKTKISDKEITLKEEDGQNAVCYLLREVGDLITSHNLTEVSVTVGSISISCRRDLTGLVEVQKSYKVNPDEYQHHPVPQLASPNWVEVKSDLVGTIYLAPSPNENPYVMIGSRISTGQTLFIIEAMKVMTHFKSPCNGIVKEILVRNEQVVEYGQVLVRVE